MSRDEAHTGLAQRTEEDPRVGRSRALIVQSAASHFLERGYQAANVDEIAAQAGVSKRTIYNLYRDKEHLFRATLDEALGTAERFSRAVVGTLEGTGDVTEQLRETGLALARAVLGGRIVPLRRLLIAEASRFPELASEYYERAPDRVIGAIADLLRRYDRRGSLSVDDPRIAAEHFAFLVIGASLDRALFDAAGASPSEEVVERRARAGVEAFVRAYVRPEPTAGASGADERTDRAGRLDTPSRPGR
jgi:TetR/AcrR family transcriptional regulator, mexJK operon transcriptional repressor